MKQSQFVAVIFALLICSGCAVGSVQNTQQNPQTAENIAAESKDVEQKVELIAPEQTDVGDSGSILEATTSADEAIVETLLVTTTVCSNGQNDDDGIDMIVYAYEPSTQKLCEVFRKNNYRGLYPANTIDFENGLLYFAAAQDDKFYDNLYVCNLQTGVIQQLTDGKYEFDDLLFLNGSLYANVAREYATVCQPAQFDFNTKTFTYRDEADDDTWHHSFSYNQYADAFLILTCSDAEMRTHRVAAETHIRPKTISLLSSDFQDSEPLYSTEEFEIRLTRQLDENTVLMTADPQMGTGPRTLKKLDIQSKRITDFDIPQLYAVSLFYPANNGSLLYLVAKEQADSPWCLYEYTLDSQQLTEISFPEQLRQIVDIQLTRQQDGLNTDFSTCIID